MGDINFSVDTGLVEALKRELDLSLFVETGTFEGDAIEICRPYFAEIHSIELSPEYYELAKSRFSQDPSVHLYLGDSAAEITKLKPVFEGRATLFWLDAHWCVASNTGGEKSQCPLIREIQGIGQLNERSAIMIDDARLFASPPPYPHEISQWPKLDEVVNALRTVSAVHELKIFNDVIVFAPVKANASLVEYMSRNTVTLLKIKDKADGYDILDAQIKDKQQEIKALKAASVDKDQEIEALKQAADDRKREMESIKAELEAECAKLTRIADERKAEMEAIKAELEAECASKDQEIEGKDSEISSLKQIANEREQAIFVLDGHVKNFQKIVADLNAIIAAKDASLGQLSQEIASQKAANAALEARFNALPSDAIEWGEKFLNKDVHIRNIEAVLSARERDIADLKQSVEAKDAAIVQLSGSLGHLEVAKYYGRQLVEKEAVIQSLKQACDEREVVIRQLSTGSALSNLWNGARALVRLKISQPLIAWTFNRVVERHWMQIGILRQYEPRPLHWEKLPKAKSPVHRLPRIAVVTPSYNQEPYIESTLVSVLNQSYPKLLYVVQDGGSRDRSPEIIERYRAKLHYSESAPDKGQGDAIRKGFSRVDDLGPDDVMAWLNSDDLMAPRALHFVADYFARHPEVDVIYGNRIIIDGEDREVARWIMPPHDPKTLEWIDYVPQETLFWRKRIWERAGGIDPTFQFALDWDLLMRFAASGARIVRLPHFLGSFRVHAHQKTSQQISSVGEEEMNRIRTRLHPQGIDRQKIEHYGRKARFWGAICSRLQEAGIRI